MDIFECSICLEQFHDPRVISCGHTFCKNCLQQLKPTQLRCPLCQRTFESVDSLPSNFVVLKWMDENKNQNIKKKDIKCDNCEDKLAVVWCENCGSGTNYCKDCDSTIHSAKALRSHARTGIKEMKKKTIFMKCQRHSEENKFFCVNCNTSLCNVCAVDDHTTHKTMSIFKYGEILKSEFNSMSTFNELKEYYNDKEIKIKEELKNIEREKVELTKKLNEINETLEKKKKEENMIIQQKRKVETSEIVLSKSIEEIGLMELMNKDNVELMKDRIKKVKEELCSSEVQQRILEEKEYTKRILTAEWWDNTGPLGGIKKGTHRSQQIYFIVSKSDKWDKGALYVPPDGYRWISTQEYPRDGDAVYSYYNQGGWNNYNWNGKEKHYFIFSDSHKTNKAKHAGTHDNCECHTSEIEGFAGIVCTK